VIPPLLIYVRIGRVPLPLPLVLLWPLLLGLLVCAAVILPLVPLRGMTVRQRVHAPFALWSMLAALRGLRTDVRPAHGPSVIVICW
jgi:hypothetical protein